MLQIIEMGEAKQALDEGFIFVGAGSRWQNPFSFEEGEYAYMAFKEWFYSSAYAAVRLRKSVKERLSDQPLMCDCGEEQYCHARVIKEFLENS